MYMRLHKGKSIIYDDITSILSYPIQWDMFYGRTFLITGASGFIALYIVRTLLRLNGVNKHKPITIVCLTRKKGKLQEVLGSDVSDKHLIIIEQDVCAPVTISHPIDYIIHAASYATPSKFGIDPVGTLMPNIIGTYHLLELAKRSKVKTFLFISSGEIYGNSPPAMKKISEEYFGSVNSVSVRSCYAESKRMGETMCVSWYHQYSVPTKIVRLFHTYGPGMTLGDGRAHSDFVANILFDKNVVLTSDGKAIRSFCYLTDSITGIFTVLCKGKPGEAYNVGNNKSISIRHLAKMIATLDKTKKIKVIYDIRDMRKKYLVSQVQKFCPDIRKITALQWKPKVSIRSGFKRTIESYR
jgi:UDP-glucuronate decarboxylase